MNTEKTHVIVNPNAAGKRTAKRWPKIRRQLEARFSNLTFEMTEGPFDGEHRARTAIKDGAELLIAVGGDGTLSEISNGLYENDALINPDLHMGFITSGTGCDIRKVYDWPMPNETEAMIDLIASGDTRKVDMGELTYTSYDGARGKRYFVNVASFGVGGAVSNKVNHSRIAKKLGGTFTFYWHALTQGIKYTNKKVRIQIDDHFDEEFSIILAVAALCPYFGGGLKIAPDADPQDGLFDFLIGHDITSSEMPGLISKIYKGTHILHPNIKMLRGKKLIATPVAGEDPVLLEVDGESPGALQSTFNVLPGALTLRG